jgi:hypothetical protein
MIPLLYITIVWNDSFDVQSKKKKNELTVNERVCKGVLPC